MKLRIRPWATLIYAFMFHIPGAFYYNLSWGFTGFHTIFTPYINSASKAFNVAVISSLIATLALEAAILTGAYIMGKRVFIKKRMSVTPHETDEKPHERAAMEGN